MSTKAQVLSMRKDRFKKITTHLLEKPPVRFAAFILGAILFSSIFSPLLTRYDPYAISLLERLQPPSLQHLFGTDELGRDVFSRVLYGGRLSLLSVVLVAFLSAPVGFFLGMYSGYKGGVFDLIVCRIVDMCFAFPRLILALVLISIFGPGLFSAILAIALTSWPAYVRLSRIEALSVKNKEFILAAKLQGASSFKLLYKYLFPLCFPAFLTRLTLDLGTIILSLASIGFLGLGAQAPSAEWGAMAASGRNYLLIQWWVALIPGVCIFMVSLSFNLLGEALADSLNPQRGVKWLS